MKESVGLKTKKLIVIWKMMAVKIKTKDTKKCVVKGKIKSKDYKNCLKATQFENKRKSHI